MIADENAGLICLANRIEELTGALAAVVEMTKPRRGRRPADLIERVHKVARSAIEQGN